MAYRQLSSEERYTIGALRREGLNASQIARRLGRDRSTISREIRRNITRHDGAYRPSKAIEYTRARRSRSRRNGHFTEADYALVVRKLKLGWSPEQIAGRLRRDRLLQISHETIYIYIWRDCEAGGELYRLLRGARKQRRKRHNSYDSRGRLAGKRHISERPASIETRRTTGHWEVDTVVGKNSKDCVVSLVERKTGYAYVGKLKDRSSRGMSQRIKMLIRRTPTRFKTITADNGTEFHDYASVEQATGARWYFATPYHSWERGSNENFNGLLRQYIPKGMDQGRLTQAHCDRIAKMLNTRPRKRLGYRTPEECFLGQP